MGTDLVLLTWVGGAVSRSVEAEAEQAYARLDGELRRLGCVPVQERAFGDLDSAAALARGRARALGASSGWDVPATFVEGAPVGRRGLAGIHVIGARGASRLVAEGDLVLGRVVEGEHARFLGLADAGRRSTGHRAAGPAEDAAAAIEAGEDLLAREGFSFRDVVRTWFYLRDILGWYDRFNAVRHAAFLRSGLLGAGEEGRIPASTGIEGRSPRGGWCTLDLLAVQSRGGAPARTERLRGVQNEATEYGSDFARALQVVLGDARWLFVSGTAAIDGRGASVHRGDFEAQVLHTLDSVGSLLEAAGARLADVAQATAFLKDPADGPALERVLGRAGLDGLPLVPVVADVCRDELLFEIDATAVVAVR
jgi:enamine deaminase RidA (YjgF/YER057c/UK114 family)